jgi:hypothetical protein
VTKLIIVVGLPGSGKSHLLRQMVSRGEVAPECVRHDYHDQSKNGTHDVDQSRFFEVAVASLKAGKTFAIADIWFCKPGHVERTSIVLRSNVPGLQVDVRYFENAPEACLANVLREGGSNVMARVQRIGELTRTYAPPAGVALERVYRAAE